VKRCRAVQPECSKQSRMFASDIKSDSSTPKIAFSDVAQERGTRVARAAKPPIGTIWLPCQPRKPSIPLPHCNDERELEYGCVDWFLYDKQRSEGSGRALPAKAPGAAGTEPASS
jgi:hypothetical protein